MALSFAAAIEAGSLIVPVGLAFTGVVAGGGVTPTGASGTVGANAASMFMAP